LPGLVALGLVLFFFFLVFFLNNVLFVYILLNKF
jgi:hypothetical protein